MGSITTEEDLVQMGRRLKRVQTLKGISDEQMAETLGITLNHYRNRVLKGKSILTSDRLFSLVSEYSISLDYIITGDESRGLFVNSKEEATYSKKQIESFIIAREVLDNFIQNSNE